ncbi:MAG: hypothetical protein COV45_05765 [Deltaproteobacteria bacterium CG11_big_fil_rev_8_21_14_0_20_47_16]|nr:MAG: hypothetical protein COV45_05765 [Deltaproteobacteria bacterium CG11_big_fil_rev_8_21_14_0_20_47_16]
MSDVSREIVVEAPIAIAFDVITNFAQYPKFLKDMKAVKVIKATKTSADVFFRLDLIRDVEYTLSFKLKSPTSVTWKLVEGSMFKKNTGSWKLKKLDANTTELTYTLEVDFGLFVPSMISKMLISQSLPATLKAFKTRIESLA